LNPQPSTLDPQPLPVRRSCRVWPVVLWSCVFCCLLSAICFLFRAPLLRTAANLWIVNDPTPHADAIVILGGGLEYRPFAAASLYSNGCAKTILITQPELPPTAEMGLTVPEFVTAREVLLRLGVPATAIQMLGTNVSSTRDEALALKQWVQDYHAHSVVIPTDIFHTRRARWIFNKTLRSTSTGVHVTAIDLPAYTAANWWKHEEGLIAFQNEVVKSAYYRLKY
jgi:uncharacterized SAM-binding protein YcdF (DUF218 family)